MNFDTEIVLKRHFDALRNRDLDRLMEDYAEDAFVISNLVSEAICGIEALREFWTRAFSTFFTPQVLSSLKFSREEIKQDVGFILWSAGPMIPFGSDTFVVRGDKIVAQTAAVQIVRRE